MGLWGPGGGEEVCCRARGPWPGLWTRVQPGGPEPAIASPSAAGSACWRAECLWKGAGEAKGLQRDNRPARPAQSGHRLPGARSLCRSRWTATSPTPL